MSGDKLTDSVLFSPQVAQEEDISFGTKIENKRKKEKDKERDTQKNKRERRENQKCTQKPNPPPKLMEQKKSKKNLTLFFE